MRTQKLFIALAFVAFSLFVISSCSKDTNPKKFDRILQKTSWRVGKATFNKQNKTDLYKKQTFKFYDGFDMEVFRETDTILGSWNRGNYGKPLRFYMYFPPADTIGTDIYLQFQREWVITYLTKTEIRMQKENSEDYEIILRSRD